MFRISQALGIGLHTRNKSKHLEFYRTFEISEYNCLYTATNAAYVLLCLNRFDLFEGLKYKGRNC